MKGFILGLLVAAFGFAGYLYWQNHLPGVPVAGPVLRPDAGVVVPKKRKRRVRGATRLVATAAAPPATARRPDPEPDPEPEPVKLSAADLKSVGQGDDLSRPDVVRLDMGDDKEARELGQDEIDRVFRAQESSLLDCISGARPDAEAYVPGRVTIKFRIQRAGTVRGVRVEAPAILQKGGLYKCVQGVVGRLRFPAAGGSQIVTYPFTLS